MAVGGAGLFSGSAGSVLKNVYVRALDLRVTKPGDHFLVTGGTAPHVVEVVNGKLVCDCMGARGGRNPCSHAAAVEIQQYQEKEKPRKMGFEVKTGAERKNVVLLPKQNKASYAGIMSGWFQFESKYGTSLGIKALVTHHAGTSYQKLNQITEAVAFVSPSWWVNDKKGKRSHLIQLCHVLTGSSYESLLEIPNDKLAAAAESMLNDGVGTGLLFIGSVQMVKKDGEQEAKNTIDKDSFESADPKFSAIVSALSSRLVIKTSDAGANYLESPKPIYQEDEQGEELESSDTASDEIPTDVSDDELPF